MNTLFTLALAATSLTMLSLAGCSSGASNTADTSGGADASGGQTSSGASSSHLATATTSLRKIVVDGKGMTVYFYDKDTEGATTSSCTGACISNWPAVTSTVSLARSAPSNPLTASHRSP